MKRGHGVIKEEKEKLSEKPPLPWHWQREEARFTIRRAYQKPPTTTVRQLPKGMKGSTRLSRAGVTRTIERLKGYAVAAAAEGRMVQARKYLRGLRAFISQVNAAGAQLEPELGQVPGVSDGAP